MINRNLERSRNLNADILKQLQIPSTTLSQRLQSSTDPLSLATVQKDPLSLATVWKDPSKMFFDINVCLLTNTLFTYCSQLNRNTKIMFQLRKMFIIQTNKKTY